MIPFLQELQRGNEHAIEIGKAVLDDASFRVWERSLKNGPVLALDQTIPAVKLNDEKDAMFLPVFMNAENLACAPRRHVLLIGLTSQSWPRFDSEDALIPDHVIESQQLNPISKHLLDEVDLETIIRTTENELIFCWPRRDSDGRRCEPSGLLPSSLVKNATELGRSRVSEQAMSEGDRLFCRPEEFLHTEEGRQSASVMRDWYSDSLTAHDGFVSENHPRIIATLSQVHSATSLKKMLRDPLGFVWQYGLGFKAPEHEDEPLLVDARQFGNILHAILKKVIDTYQKRGGWMQAPEHELKAYIRFARDEVAKLVEIDQQVPPDLIWHDTLARAEIMAFKALTYPFTPLPGQTSFGELPFGSEKRNIANETQLFVDCTVKIPGTDIHVQGSIDRLDISGDKTMGRVVDYKSGKTPKDLASIRLKGGNEIQRPLYLYVVKTLIEEITTIEAGLLYPMTGDYAPAEDAETLMEELAFYVSNAVDYLKAGFALPGEGAKETFNGHLFALPSNASATYLTKVLLAAEHKMPELAKLWSEE